MVKLLPPFGGGFEGEDPNDRIHTHKKTIAYPLSYGASSPAIRLQKLSLFLLFV